MTLTRRNVCLLGASMFLYYRVLKFLHFDATTILLGAVIGCLSLYVAYEVDWKRRRLPNGPCPWLVAGNMPSFVLAKNVDELFVEWKKKFGGIFTVWIGPIPLIMVADLPTIRKYFVQHADLFSNRWRNVITDTIMKGANGVVQIDGDKWREQRRFALHTLRDFGVGRPLMEEKIMLEVDAMTDYLEDCQNQQINLFHPIAVCVGNIINNMLFGVRFAQGDERMQRLHSLLDRQSHMVMKSIMGLYIVAPFTTKIPVVNGPWTELMAIRDSLCAFLQQQIEKHKECWAQGNRSDEDLTYAYMKEVQKRRDAGEDVGCFDDLQLQMLLLDLFFAGMETTVTTLKWAFLLVARDREVQSRVQRELDSVGGSSISLGHRPLLPYTQATINEIQRVANILPFNLLRTVAEDVSIDGFELKKGCLIIPQISILMNDSDVFEDPARFNPDRFLDGDGNVKRIEEFLPFSVGRRQCLGESLARAELFLIFANLLSKFEFSVEDDVQPKRVLGLTVSPSPYNCTVRRRKFDENQNLI